MSETQPELPGFVTPAIRSPLETAALAMLERLQADGRLNDPARHLLGQALLEAAHVIGRAAQRGQAAATAMALRELRDTLTAITQPDEVQDDERAEFERITKGLQ